MAEALNFTLSVDSSRQRAPVDRRPQAHDAKAMAVYNVQAAAFLGETDLVLSIEFGPTLWQSLIRLNGEPLPVTRITVVMDLRQNRYQVHFDTEYFHVECDIVPDPEQPHDEPIGQLTATLGIRNLAQHLWSNDA